ncbi:hypothetical protein MTR_8g024170 [Medicago truncatula]|uniref:Uncharacterized protein n=1 Tax=Medicago truncatula TaxID=3880 RepID=A0A072TMW7_MEDTR|nr:hypothetical protein MTR_8g024170 [Medicago truncatula]
MDGLMMATRVEIAPRVSCDPTNNGRRKLQRFYGGRWLSFNGQLPPTERRSHGV